MTQQRCFSLEYKQSIIDEIDNSHQRGKLTEVTKREGLFNSHICSWRKQLAAEKKKPSPARHDSTWKTECPICHRRFPNIEGFLPDDPLKLSVVKLTTREGHIHYGLLLTCMKCLSDPASFSTVNRRWYTFEGDIPENSVGLCPSCKEGERPGPIFGHWLNVVSVEFFKSF